MMKKQLHYLSLLILLSLCGCEVALHDNYVKTEPLPLETPIEINLDAELNDNGEFILVEDVGIGFRINTPESRFVSASFYIDDNLVYESNSLQGWFKVFRSSLAENCLVKCKIITKSLSQGESIRDQAYDGQTYVGEMSWPARFVVPQLTFYQLPEDISLDNITIRWTFNLSNYYFKVISDGEIMIPKTKETSITIPTPPFGTHKYMEVRVVDEAGNDFFVSSANWYYYSGPGTRLKGGQMRSVYNSYSKTLYTSEYGEVTSYSIPSLNKISEYNESRTNGTPIAAAPNSDKIAVDYSDLVCIFSGKDLKLIAEIDYPEASYAPQNILLTSNNKLILYYSYLSKVYIYDADNGQLEKVISLSETNFSPEDYRKHWNYQMSESYLCEPIISGFYLTPLQNFEKGKSVFYPQDYNTYSFHPAHPHELIVTDTNNKVFTLDCRSGEIIRTIAKGRNYTFCNIDPVTGNYLFQTASHIVITDENGEELFRLKSEASNPYLTDNILICWNGTALNVEPYLKKP